MDRSRTRRDRGHAAAALCAAALCAALAAGAHAGQADARQECGAGLVPAIRGPERIACTWLTG